MVIILQTDESFGLHALFSLVHRFMVQCTTLDLHAGERARVMIRPYPGRFIVVLNERTNKETAFSLKDFIRIVFDVSDEIEVSLADSAWIRPDVIDDPVFGLRFLNGDYNAWMQEVSLRSRNCVKDIVFYHTIEQYSYTNEVYDCPEWCIEERTVPDFGPAPVLLSPDEDWTLVTTDDPRG